MPSKYAPSPKDIGYRQKSLDQCEFKCPLLEAEAATRPEEVM